MYCNFNGCRQEILSGSAIVIHLIVDSPLSGTQIGQQSRVALILVADPGEGFDQTPFSAQASSISLEILELIEPPTPLTAKRF